MKLVSVVIPVLDEKENLQPLYERLVRAFHKLKVRYEILFVDDGSSDGTLEKILKLHEADKGVKVISFQRNFGKAAALSAGFEAVKGDVVFTMDGDLQDLPEEIPNFLKVLEKEGRDMVVGWRFKRQDKFLKRTVSKFFNWLGRKITKLRIHDANCGFKVMKTEVAKDLNLYGEMHRYIPAIAFLQGYKVSELKIDHAERLHGKTKYNLSRLWKGFFDLFTVRFLASFSRRPFHLFGSLGFFSLGLGMLLGLWLFSIWFATGTIGGRIGFAIFSMILMMLGMQLISLGFLGEMMASRRQKSYIVKLEKI